MPGLLMQKQLFHEVKGILASGVSQPQAMDMEDPMDHMLTKPDGRTPG